MLKKLLSDFGFYGVIPFIPKLANVFVLPLITPFLTATDYGVFGIIMSYVSLSQIIYSLGIQVNLPNSFYKSKSQYKWQWRQIYGFWILWGFLFAAVLAALLYFLIPAEAEKNALAIIILLVIPIVVFGPTTAISETLYQLKRQPKEVVSRSVIGGLLTVTMTYFFIAHLKLGYMGWFYSSFITTLVINASWWYPLNIINKITPIFNFKWRTIKKALKIGIPVIPHTNALILLTQSDKIVMDRLQVSTQNIGLYDAAYKIANIFDMVSFAFSRALTPYVYQLIKDKKESLLRKIIFFSQLVFFIAALLFSCVAKEVLEFLIRNDELNTVYPLMVLIVMSMIFKPMYTISTTRVLYHEKTKLFGIHSLFAGLINVVLNIIFIPIYGIEAAALTTILGYMILSFIRFFTNDFKKNNPLNYYPVGWILASAAICAIGYYTSMFPQLYRVIIFLTLLVLLAVSMLWAKKQLQHENR